MNFTFHTDAVALVSRITTAPDEATKLNLLEELTKRYVALATETQMLAESNQRWAEKHQDITSRIETNLEAMLSRDSELIDDVYFKRIAEIIDMSLDVDFDVTVKLEYKLTVTAPRGTTTSEIEEAIEWRNEQKFTGKEEWEVRNSSWGTVDDYEIKAELN